MLCQNIGYLYAESKRVEVVPPPFLSVECTRCTRWLRVTVGGIRKDYGHVSPGNIPYLPGRRPVIHLMLFLHSTLLVFMYSFRPATASDHLWLHPGSVHTPETVCNTLAYSARHLIPLYALPGRRRPSPPSADTPPYKQIDDLRRERVLFDTIYKKMERELSDRKKMMANVIEVGVAIVFLSVYLISIARRLFRFCNPNPLKRLAYMYCAATS